MQAQAQYARAVLDSPGRQHVGGSRRSTRQGGGLDTVQRGSRYFYQRMPEDQVAKLYYQRDARRRRSLPRPGWLGTAKAHAALDYFAPSWDGRLIAYGVSLGGSEESVLHVLDVSGKRTFAEAIDRTMLSASSPGCRTTADSSTCATRNPRPI